MTRGGWREKGELGPAGIDWDRSGAWIRESGRGGALVKSRARLRAQPDWQGNPALRW